MAKELLEKVLTKIEKGKRLLKKEEVVVVELQRQGLAEVTQDQVKLTPYGGVITNTGYNSVRRAEEMERELSTFFSEEYDRTKFVLAIMNM